MLNSKKTLVKVSGIALALAASSEFVAASLMTRSAVAQSPTPTTFPLPSTVPSGSSLKVDGSSSMEVTNEALRKRYEEQFPGATVNLSTSTTDEALKALQAGTLDLAAVGRALTDEEKAQVVSVPLEREKIAIIVGPDNPFKGNLTFEQFARMFRGEIKDWSEVGGPAGPIRFVDRPNSSDTRLALSKYQVFQVAPFETGANATQVAQDDTDEVIQALGKDGISYSIANQVLDKPNVRVVPMHQTLPDDPRYPFSQPQGYAHKQGAALSPAQLGFLGLATGATAAAVPAAASTPEASPTPEAVVSPSPTPVATQNQGGGFPWWLLLLPLLAIPFLFRGRRSAPVAPPPAPVPPPPAPVPAPVPVAAPIAESRIILTPRDCRNAYAYWEVPEERKAEMRRQGGRKLMVRLYDVTDIDMDRQTPHSVKQFDCDEADPDLHLPISVDDRDYIAELGYVTDDTDDGRWLKVARSPHVRVPACPVVEDGLRLPNVAAIGGVAAAGLGAVAAARAVAPEPEPVVPVVPPTPPAPNRIILTPRNSEAAYAYWEAPEVNKAALRERGGRNLQLRIYDATDLDLDTQPAHSVQTYDVSEVDQDRHVPIPQPERDYVAEIGYDTADGEWLKLARSAPIRVHAPKLPEVAPIVAPAIGGVALAGAAIAKAVAPDEVRVPEVPSRIILTPRNSEAAYAYWEAPEVNKAALRERGGRQLQLRIYDATDLNLDTQPAHSVQTYDVDEVDQDRHVPIPQPERDYVAEVGYVTGTGEWLKLARSTPIRIATPAAPAVVATPEAATADARPITLPSPILNTSPMPAHRLGEVVPSRVEYAGTPTAAPLPTADRCSIQQLRVNSRTNCYLMDAEQMNRLQSQTAATHALEVGQYLVRIKNGMFGYRSSGNVFTGEPLVLLWLYGGRVVNKKTNVAVNATWSSLNGYAETLTLEVLEPATLCAFFFDTHKDDNEGEVTVSIVKL
jgi:phosphate transport system substrate-binding protein